MIRVVLLVSAIAIGNAFLFGSDPDWDGLRVTFDPLIWQSQAFAKLPRTAGDAATDGWSYLDNQCTSSAQEFRGHRYIKDNDPAVILIYDKNGFIAGIQTAPPKTKYTPNKVTEGHVMLSDGTRWSLTAYFVDPETICTIGRSSADFKNQGTGTTLRLQVGPNPETQTMLVPLEESDIKKNPLWGNGKCLPLMGQHYWFNVTKGMNCDNFFPYCVLYTSGKLNAFCFAIDKEIQPTKRYEHPTSLEAKACCLNAPDCFFSDPRHSNGAKQSTMHVYMTDSPWKNLCPLIG